MWKIPNLLCGINIMSGNELKKKMRWKKDLS